MCLFFFFFKQKTAYEIGLGIPADRSSDLKLLRRITRTENILHRNFTRRQVAIQNRVASNIGIRDRKSGSAGMPRPTSYAVFCLKKKNNRFDHALFRCDRPSLKTERHAVIHG